MNTQLISRLALVLLLLSAGMEWACGSEVPRKSPVGRYVKLWANSVFTEKPPPDELPPEESELDDYTLAGVSPMEGGYSVILINKKERTKRVHLMPGLANKEGFTVVGVRQDPISSKNTTVEIATASGKKGRVGYEEKYLALKSPAAKPAAPAKRPTNTPTPPATNGRTTQTKPQQQIPGITPQQRPTNTGDRRPRVRRVPTPPTNR